MMSIVQIHERDNVVVVLRENEKNIPFGHKAARVAIAKGEPVIKYGYPIGVASADIRPGEWVHDHNLQTALTGPQEYEYVPSSAPLDTLFDERTFMGYERADGEVGVRNEIWIIPTVGCVNGLAERAAESLRRSGLSERVDDVVVFSHPYGCSQLGEDHAATRNILADLVRHPNAGGVLVLGLGCENNTMESFKKQLGPVDPQRVKFVVAQEADDERAECENLLRELYATASQDERVPVPVSKLRIGLKCGGSDACSGVTANPLVGAVSDQLIARGGAAVLTEIPEVFGAETILFNRAVNETVFQDAVELVNDFKTYFLSHGEPVGENPSPGNKAGGITTLEEKSLGCVQKGGRASLVDVLRYGDRIRQTGLSLLEGPGNDMVAVTALAAAGCQMVLFTTGRGTPLGGPVPVIKIASNSALALRKENWIDFNADVLLKEDPVDARAVACFELVLASASGTKTCNENNGYRDFAIWKSGVTL